MQNDKKKKLSLAQAKQFIPLYLMMIPGLLYLLINNYIPMTGIIVAFKKYNVNDGIYRSPWNGLKNFEYLLTSNDAFTIIRNTFCYNVAFIIVNNVVAIILAIMICDVAHKGLKKLYQSSILLPFLVSIVVTSYIVFAFLSHENGMFNSLLVAQGKDKILWYNTPKYWPFVLTICSMWKNTGYSSILYLAAITGIDQGQYEAAAIDGADKWQQIKYITLPNLRPMISILLIMNVGHIFNSDFGLFYTVPLNSGALYSVTQTIDTYIYRVLTATNNIGMSTAGGLLQNVVGFIFIMIANRIVQKIDEDSSLF